jgi:hypothetical protein
MSLNVKFRGRPAARPEDCQGLLSAAADIQQPTASGSLTASQLADRVDRRLRAGARRSHTPFLTDRTGSSSAPPEQPGIPDHRFRVPAATFAARESRHRRRPRARAGAHGASSALSHTYSAVAVTHPHRLFDRGNPPTKTHNLGLGDPARLNDGCVPAAASRLTGADRLDHATGILAAVGNEDLLEHDALPSSAGGQPGSRSLFEECSQAFFGFRGRTQCGDAARHVLDDVDVDGAVRDGTDAMRSGATNLN